MADSPGTEAGRRLLDGLGLGRPDAVARVYAECLADVEREARAAALAAVRERVEPGLDALDALDEARRLLGYLWTATGKNHLREVRDLFDPDDTLVADVERVAIFVEPLEDRP